VQSFDIPDSDRVRVVAELAAAERDDGLLESAVSRLSLEPLVTHVRWEVEPSK
ncbi:MAG: MgtC/SapB family protein, partial [Rhodococcus sp. (in: high G+C Gram-positive bacteria)]